MKTCGKTAYTSEHMAKHQAQWLERKGKVLRPYQCDICFLWHLTSEIEPVLRKMKKNYKTKNG